MLGYHLILNTIYMIGYHLILTIYMLGYHLILITIAAVNISILHFYTA
jgi:hypothetical protein